MSFQIASEPAVPEQRLSPNVEPDEHKNSFQPWVTAPGKPKKLAGVLMLRGSLECPQRAVQISECLSLSHCLPSSFIFLWISQFSFLRVCMLSL